MKIYEMADNYIKENLSELKNITVELCQIPSMTGSEEKKALYTKNKIRDITGEDPMIDEAGNVLFVLKGSNDMESLLLAAHIDTVFKDLYEINVTERDGKLFAPSVMDNSINAAALLFIIKMFRELGISTNRDIIFAFTVGEEGTGNLKGIRTVMQKYKGIVCGAIAVDCNLDSVVTGGVGSKRYEIKFKTRGGHSWSDFGNRSAILYAARLVEKLYDIKVPEEPKTTYNAGIISGGTSINTIAEDANVLIDLRSEDEASLERLNNDFMKIVKELTDDSVCIEVIPIGDRPCGHLNKDSLLFKNVVDIRNELGLENRLVSSSTDANIPLSIGIPAVSFGVCRGGGTHTRNEFLYLDSIEAGINNLTRLVLKITEAF